MRLSDLSVLIPTHNRPKLFERCLNSIFKSEIAMFTNVIVNDDSAKKYAFDFIEKFPYKEHIQIFENSFENLTLLYEFLISKVQTPWFWILEDDDMAINALKAFQEIETNKEIIGGSYLSSGNAFVRFNLESSGFQLSQVIFRTKPLRFNFSRCSGDCVYNDYFLVKDNYESIEVSPRCFFKQTTDGKDNLSFPEYTDLKKCEKCPIHENFKHHQNPERSWFCLNKI